jgi:hypothetical protein
VPARRAMNSFINGRKKRLAKMAEWPTKSLLKRKQWQKNKAFRDGS